MISDADPALGQPDQFVGLSGSQFGQSGAYGSEIRAAMGRAGVEPCQHVRNVNGHCAGVGRWLSDESAAQSTQYVPIGHGSKQANRAYLNAHGGLGGAAPAEKSLPTAQIQ